MTMIRIEIPFDAERYRRHAMLRWELSAASTRKFRRHLLGITLLVLLVGIAQLVLGYNTGALVMAVGIVMLVWYRSNSVAMYRQEKEYKTAIEDYVIDMESDNNPMVYTLDDEFFGYANTYQEVKTHWTMVRYWGLDDENTLAVGWDKRGANSIRLDRDAMSPEQFQEVRDFLKAKAEYWKK